MKLRQVLCVCAVLLGTAVLLPAEIRVTMADAMKAATSKPTPEYNPIARQMRVSGDVEVEVHVDASGAVDSVKVIKGNAMLTGNVVGTVKRWKFTPFTANGTPTDAVVTLQFSFKL